MNLYVFVNNSPMSFYDARGLKEECPCSPAEEATFQQQKADCYKAASASYQSRVKACNETRDSDSDVATLSSSFVGVAVLLLDVNPWAGAVAGFGLKKAYGGQINRRFRVCMGQADSTLASDNAVCDAMSCSGGG